MSYPATNRLNDYNGPNAPRSWQEWLLPNFQGANPDLVEHMLLRVLRMACRECSIWLAETPLLIPDVGITDYAIPTPFTRTEVVSVLYGIDDQKREWYSLERGSDFFFRNRQISFNFPRTFTSPEPGMIRFRPMSLDDVVTLAFMVTLAPQTVDVPDWMLRTHMEMITTGVNAYMWMTPQKPYTNMERGKLELQMFRSLLAKERDRAAKGYVPGIRSWQYPRFGV